MFLPQSIFSRVKHVGISISPYVVRAVIVDTTGKITQKAESKSDQLIFSGDEVNIPKLSELLKDIKHQLSLDEFYAACCFPEKFAYSHEHILPPLNNSEIGEAIRWQLESIFPLRPEDLYTDWKLIEKTDKDTRVVITAVSKQFLDGLVAGFNIAKIKPVSFESSTSALARSLKTIPKNALIIEIDNFGSSVTLVENGISTLTATTNFSTATDSQAVLSEIVATIRQLKNRIPIDTENSEEIPLFVTGEKAVPELVKIIGDQLNQPLQNLSTDTIPNSFQCAYLESLSTVEAPESTTSINLLPETLEKKYRLETDLTQTKIATSVNLTSSIITLLASVALFIVSLVFVASSTQKLSAVADPPAPPSQINLPILLQKSQKIVQFQTYEYIPKSQLDIIFTTISPSNITQFSYDASKKIIKLTLKNLDRTQLFNLKATLDETNLFNQISIPLSALNSTEDEGIVLVLGVKDKP